MSRTSGMLKDSLAEAPSVSPAKTLLKWHVYVIRCSDNSLYTGITTDVEKRFRQHSEGKGAKYFRGRAPLQVVYCEDSHSHSSAAAREYRIKCMNRAEKEFMVASLG